MSTLLTCPTAPQLHRRPRRLPGAPLASVLAALVVTACMTPPAPPLEPEDFALTGVPLDADTTEIRLSFGEPDSVHVDENPFDAEQPLTIWFFDGFEVRFSGDRAVGYMVRAGDESTLRGVRVGTPADSVLRLYGPPTTSEPSRITYAEADDLAGLRVIDFVVQDEVVSRIYVGAALR